MVLNNRELASLIWLAVAAAWVLSRRDLRSGIADILKSLAEPSPAVCRYSVCWLDRTGDLGRRKLGLWNTGLVPNTVVWTVGTALVLCFNVTRPPKTLCFSQNRKECACGQRLRRILYHLFVFGLLAELILQFVLIILIMVDVFSNQKPEFQQLKKVLDALLIGVGVLFLGYTIVQFYAQWTQLDRQALLLKLALPAWLTLGVLPFIYVLSLYTVYEGALRGVNWATSDWRARWRTRFVLVAISDCAGTNCAHFTLMWIKRAAVAPDVTGARAVVQRFRDEQRLPSKRT